MTRRRGRAGALLSMLAVTGAAGCAQAGHPAGQPAAHASPSPSTGVALQVSGSGNTTTTNANSGIVLQVSGGGNATTAAYTTGLNWTLHFTYACPDTGPFRVVEHTGTQIGLPIVDTSGPSGQAKAYVANGPGSHYLVVSTPCQWTLTVVDGEEIPRA